MTLRRIDYEEEADLFLREYTAKTGYAIAPPVPIELIVEELSDFEVLYDNEELSSNESGRIDFARKRITIRYDEIEGRQRFSLAHEAGHFRLHSHKVDLGTPPILGLFGDSSQPHLSRRDSSDWHEVEANRFAAAALMPLCLLRPAFKQAREQFRYYLPSRPQQMMRTVQTYLASQFKVSNQAMGIRLKTTGLAAELFTERMF